MDNTSRNPTNFLAARDVNMTAAGDGSFDVMSDDSFENRANFELLERLKEEVREKLLVEINGVEVAGGGNQTDSATSLPWPFAENQATEGQVANLQSIVKRKAEGLKWYWGVIEQKIANADLEGGEIQRPLVKSKILDFFQCSLIDQINMLQTQIDLIPKRQPEATNRSQPEDQSNPDEAIGITIDSESCENAKKAVNGLLRELFGEGLIQFRQAMNNLDDSLLKECLASWSVREDHLKKDVSPRISDINSSPLVQIPKYEYYKNNQRRYVVRNLYEQEKFNLLREQNEGYAKLIIILDSIRIEKLAQIEEQLDQAQRNIVGNFSIDPNRVVDILLESLENHLGQVVHDQRTNQKTGSQDVTAHYVIDSPDIDQLVSTFLKLIETWLPQKSTREYVVSAILGFKVQHCMNTIDYSALEHSQQDPKTVVPYNLILLVAILIRDDVIKLEKIMPYFVQKQKKVTNGNGGAVDSQQNAGTTATENINTQQPQQNSKTVNQPNALKIEFEDQVPDDIQQYHQQYKEYLNRVYMQIDVNYLDPQAKDQEKTKQAEMLEAMREICRKKIPYNFQLWLVTCLLQVNDLEDADLLISTLWTEKKFDLTIHKDLLCTLFELLEVMIKKLYQSTLSPQPQTSWFKNKSVSKDLRTLKANPKGIIVCETAEDLVTNLGQILNIFGVYLCQNYHIYSKLVRTVNYHLIEKCPNGQFQQQAFFFAGEYFLPALCINNDQNYELDDILWVIMSKMEYHRRYHYYYQLMSHGYLSNYQMLERFTKIYPKAKQWTKHICREENKIQEQRLQTMKIANGGNALILAQQILFMCKNCSNLIEPIIQSMERALRDLGLDMMTFILLRHMSEKQETFKQIDGEGNLAPECTNFIQLTSLFFKTFQHVDLRPFFVYILNRLRDGDNTNEAFVISGILTSMSGWKDLPITLLNSKQLQCLAGGIKLKVDIIEMSQEFKKSKQRKYISVSGPCSHQRWSTAEALINVLYEIPSKNNQDSQENAPEEFSLAFSLMANLAQQAHFVVDIMDCDDMMRLQSTFDRTHQLFRQFVDTVYFLEEDTQKFKQLLPDPNKCIKLLSRTYRVPFQYSLYIMRYSFKQLYEMNDDEFKLMVDVYSGIFDETIKNKKEMCLNDHEQTLRWLEKKKQREEKLATLEADVKMEEEEDDWDDWEDDYPYFDEMKYLNAKYNDSLWTMFTREIFSVFWKLELQDIQLPESIYQQQIDLKEVQIAEIWRNGTGSSGDKLSTEQQKKNKKEVDSLQKMIFDLKTELDQVQRIKYEKTMTWIQEKMTDLFNQIENEKKVSEFFVQHCLFPRILFSPADAVYCIRFIKVLVELRVPKINILNIFARIMQAIIRSIHSCTLDESENLGIFFMEWFQLMDRWASENGEIWKKECAGYTGFSRWVGSQDQDSIIKYDVYLKEIVEQLHVRFSFFVKRYFLTNPEESNQKEFMKTKSALKILYKIRFVYPKNTQIAQEIFSQVEQIMKVNKLKIDIQTLAMRYQEELKKIHPKLETKDKQEQSTRNVQNSQQALIQNLKQLEAEQSHQGNGHATRQRDSSPNNNHDNHRGGGISPSQGNQQNQIQSSSKNSQHMSRQKDAPPSRLGQKRYHDEGSGSGGPAQQDGNILSVQKRSKPQGYGQQPHVQGPSGGDQEAGSSNNGQKKRSQGGAKSHPNEQQSKGTNQNAPDSHMEQNKKRQKVTQERDEDIHNQDSSISGRPVKRERDRDQDRSQTKYQGAHPENEQNQGQYVSGSRNQNSDSPPENRQYSSINRKMSIQDQNNNKEQEAVQRINRQWQSNMKQNQNNSPPQVKRQSGPSPGRQDHPSNRGGDQQNFANNNRHAQVDKERQRDRQPRERERERYDNYQGGSQGVAENQPNKRGGSPNTHNPTMKQQNQSDNYNQRSNSPGNNNQNPSALKTKQQIDIKNSETHNQDQPMNSSFQNQQKRPSRKANDQENQGDRTEEGRRNGGNGAVGQSQALNSGRSVQRVLMKNSGETTIISNQVPKQKLISTKQNEESIDDRVHGNQGSDQIPQKSVIDSKSRLILKNESKNNYDNIGPKIVKASAGTHDESDGVIQQNARTSQNEIGNPGNGRQIKLKKDNRFTDTQMTSSGNPVNTNQSTQRNSNEPHSYPSNNQPIIQKRVQNHFNDHNNQNQNSSQSQKQLLNTRTNNQYRSNQDVQMKKQPEGQQNTHAKKSRSPSLQNQRYVGNNQGNQSRNGQNQHQYQKQIHLKSSSGHEIEISRRQPEDMNHPQLSQEDKIYSQNSRRSGSQSRMPAENIRATKNRNTLTIERQNIGTGGSGSYHQDTSQSYAGGGSGEKQQSGHGSRGSAMPQVQKRPQNMRDGGYKNSDGDGSQVESRMRQGPQREMRDYSGTQQQHYHKQSIGGNKQPQNQQRKHQNQQNVNTSRQGGGGGNRGNQSEGFSGSQDHHGGGHNSRHGASSYQGNVQYGHSNYGKQHPNSKQQYYASGGKNQEHEPAVSRRIGGQKSRGGYN